MKISNKDLSLTFNGGKVRRYSNELFLQVAVR